MLSGKRFKSMFKSICVSTALVTVTSSYVFDIHIVFRFQHTRFNVSIFFSLRGGGGGSS